MRLFIVLVLDNIQTNLTDQFEEQYDDAVCALYLHSDSSKFDWQVDEILRELQGSA